jgi:hypothetical protein
MSNFVNITSMVYIKNSDLIDWSGEYKDYRVDQQGIFIMNRGRYMFSIYGPLHVIVQAGNRLHVLKDTIILDLEQYDLVRLLHLEHKREFYETTVLLHRCAKK